MRGLMLQFDYCSAYPETLQTGESARDFLGGNGSHVEFPAWMGMTDIFSTLYSINLDYMYYNLGVFRCVTERAGKKIVIFCIWDIKDWFILHRRSLRNYT